MPKYRISNPATSAYEIVVAPNRKAAHEVAQIRWPGVPTLVRSTEEHELIQHTRWFYDHVTDAAEAIEDTVDECSDLKAMRRQLDIIEAHTVHLRQILEDIERARAPSKKEVHPSQVVGESTKRNHES